LLRTLCHGCSPRMQTVWRKHWCNAATSRRRSPFNLHQLRRRFPLVDPGGQAAMAATAGSRIRAAARNGDDVNRSWRALDFSTLPAFSRLQVAAWNALQRAVAGEAGWQTWITEGLADLFESPAGLEIRLRQKHTMDPQRPEAIFTSTAGEVTLGR